MVFGSHGCCQLPVIGHRRGGRYVCLCTLLLMAVLTAIAVPLASRKALALGAQQLALRQLRRGAISNGEAWLRWAVWLDEDDGSTDLLQAFCFRHRQLTDRWVEALRSAARKGTGKDRIERELRLQLAWSGMLPDDAGAELMADASAAVTDYDVPTAMVYGSLENRRYDWADRLLAAWEMDAPNEPQVVYMRAKYWESRGDTNRMLQCLQSVLAAEPRHELAGGALASALAKNGQLDLALDTYLQVSAATPSSDIPTLGIATVLRTMGLGDLAQSVLSGIAARRQPSPELAVEMGQLEMEAGNYQEAIRWFQRADFEEVANIDLLATALALQGDSIQAEQYFTLASKARNRIVRLYDLRTRLSVGAGDKAARLELDRLLAPQTMDAREGKVEVRPKRSAAVAFSARGLYEAKCAACHGATGNGDGRAARHLFPRPRDLRNDAFRLVSTTDGIPTLDDIVTVLDRGVPGSAMPSFHDLGGQNLVLLAEEVVRLRREGARERFVQGLGSDEEEVDFAKMERYVNYQTTPGKAVVVPRIGPADEQSLARGKKLYATHGCISCHGADGVGTWESTWFDRRLHPIRPRDLAHEPLKGGADAESVYLRIVVGMPGSPHPASNTMTEAEVTDLVHYCRSLVSQNPVILTNQQRAAWATSTAYLTAIGRNPRPPE